MKQIVKIGTRGSKLALWQANYIKTELTAAIPDIDFETIILKTTGDRDQKSSLTKIGGMGVFTKTIEDALIADTIDIAVHSLKDLPSQENKELIIAAVPERGPVADVLVSKDGTQLADLPRQARVATGSIRRRSQLLAMRPDLRMEDLRGNIDTRLQKLESEGWDAIVMAHAAIQRLELDSIKYSILPIEDMVPAVSQGAIGVQCRASNAEIISMIKTINDEQTYRAVMAERAVLRSLDSGCQFPIGAHAKVDSNNDLSIQGFVGDMSGTHIIKKTKLGKASEAENVGAALAKDLIADGALDLLKPFQNDTEE